jgi:photosystem II stability/assembly factor-like uncharacterized protein
LRLLRFLLLFSLAALDLGVVAARAQGTNALASRDGMDVWAVGDSGRYYRSFDGGASWSFGNLGSRPLRGVVTRGLSIVVVGDSGKIWRSADNGGTWAIRVAAGTPALRAVQMPTDLIGYAVGDGGAIFKTTNGGGTWVPQTSGTAARLFAVRFTSALDGWVAGAGGFVARTTNGGGVWTQVAIGAMQDLFGLDVKGSTLWAVGAGGTARHSVDGGTVWTPVDLKIDSHADVRAVWVQSPDSIVLGGGGGFIRRSLDGGETWSFPIHSMHAPISALWCSATSTFAGTSLNRVVMRSTNFGATWALPTGATLKRSWTSRWLPPAVSIRGSTLGLNPQNRHTLFCLLGAQVYRSVDDGETWQPQGNAIPATLQTNAFVVSPKDSNAFLAASVDSLHTSGHIFKSTDGGVTWTAKLTHLFGEYGIPLEVNPDKPDTVFFAGESDSLFRSTDFGSTWAKWSLTKFRSPCDIVVVPDSSNIMQLGDGTTGSGQGEIWRSTDSGRTWTLHWTNGMGGSEVPGMSCSRLRNGTSIATNWGSGGVNRSTDFGNSWSQVAPTVAAWGTDFAKDDPNVVIHGQYSGGRSYLSLDGGATFAFADTTHLPFANYSFYLRDRGLILAEQNNGIWKMTVAYAFTPVNSQSVSVTAPNGGESWVAGTVHAITWNGTNLGLVRIEYRRSPADPWHLVADVAGAPGTYPWTVPPDLTTQAQVRISDAWDASPIDVSNAVFAITQPAIGVAPPSLAFGSVGIGAQAAQVVTVSNPGTAVLTVSGVTTGSAAFTPGRASLTVAPGASDTLSVTFGPTALSPYNATLTLTSDAPTSPTLIPLSGTGTDTLHLTLLAPNGGEVWSFGTLHAITWSSALVDSVALEVQTSLAGPWLEIAPTLPAAAGTYAWSIPDLATASARVRVRQRNGTASDSSDGSFHLTVPRWEVLPDSIDFGPTPVGATNVTPMRFQNVGTATLAFSVAGDNPDVHPGRANVAIPPGASDTLGIFYAPGSVGPDACTLTFTSNDPAGPHVVHVTGSGTASTDVTGPPPTAFALEPNRPNPFTRSTLVSYALPREARVSVEVFDLQGHRVALLVEGVQPAGRYSVRFGTVADRSGAEPTSGVYFVRLRADGWTTTRKILRVR